MNDDLYDSACYSQHCSVDAVFEVISNAIGVLWSGTVWCLKWKQTHIV